MYEQAAIPAVNKEPFDRTKAALLQVFAPANAEKFLRSVVRDGLRVRDFEVVLQRELLGDGARQDYAALTDPDRGQVRELYLRLVEEVSPELRKKYMKVYTYY